MPGRNEPSGRAVFLKNSFTPASTSSGVGPAAGAPAAGRKNTHKARVLTTVPRPLLFHSRTQFARPAGFLFLLGRHRLGGGLFAAAVHQQQENAQTQEQDTGRAQQDQPELLAASFF